MLTVLIIIVVILALGRLFLPMVGLLTLAIIAGLICVSFQDENKPASAQSQPTLSSPLRGDRGARDMVQRDDPTPKTEEELTEETRQPQPGLELPRGSQNAPPRSQTNRLPAYPRNVDQSPRTPRPQSRSNYSGNYRGNPTPVLVEPMVEPIGWVYIPYTLCTDPRCSTGVVNVPADGLNVRDDNGQPIVSLINGTPLVFLQRNDAWMLVGAACDLVPTGTWSVNANVPLLRCF